MNRMLLNIPMSYPLSRDGWFPQSSINILPFVIFETSLNFLLWDKELSFIRGLLNAC